LLEGLVTDHARLVVATPRLLDAELTSFADLAFELGAPLSGDWPPQGWDRMTITWLRQRLLEHPEEHGWWTAYLVSLDDVVVGTVGLKGPPRDGEVQLGYGLVPSVFGMGYAMLAVETIVEAARGRGDIERVVAHTDETGSEASIAVLDRTGFERDDAVGQAGTLRFVHRLGRG
jgi:RimJ/RimL family protein N-acetyltransferase